jgi:alanine racemase
MTRPSYIEINLPAIQSNLAVAKRLAPNAKVLACVKADAYGHGAVEVARSLQDSADLLGLACLDEALELKEFGINTPALLLEGCFDETEWRLASEQGFSSAIHNQNQLDTFLNSQLAKPVNIWLKMDSGMHRLGFDPNNYKAAYLALSQSKHCASLTLMSHFACSEELDNPFNNQQLETFLTTTQGLDGQCSMANSAAILTRPDTHLDWIRPGYMLYGNSPMAGESPFDRELTHAMSLCTEVISIRDIGAGEGVGYNHAWRADAPSRIAVAAIGYGDGYPRNAKNGSPVLVDGNSASTVGHIAMDMMLIDVSHLPNTRVGSKVELWGPDLPASKVAEHSGMSGYELLTRLTKRLPRRYLTAS